MKSQASSFSCNETWIKIVTFKEKYRKSLVFIWFYWYSQLIIMIKLLSYHFSKSIFRVYPILLSKQKFLNHRVIFQFYTI